MAKTVAQQALDNSDLILDGNLLAIDPSSTSMGYAVFEKGVFQHGGEKRYKGKDNIRLNLVGHDVCTLIEDNYIDFIAVERLRSSGGYSAVQLIWSVGVVLAAVPLPYIEVSPQAWKTIARRDNVIKTDANDALCIGLKLIELAKGIN